MKNTAEKTTKFDAPRFSFAEVQRFTGLSKSDLQNYSRYITPAAKAIGRGNRSLYSARNVFCFFVFDQLSRLGVPVSIAHEWATTSLVMGEVAFAWFIVPGSDKGKPLIGVKHMYETADDPGWSRQYKRMYPDSEAEYRGEDFEAALGRRMDTGHAFAVIPTGRIFEAVCRATGTDIPA